MKTSIFELFRVGIGPSSSHTVGPMRAALRFAEELKSTGRLEQTRRVSAELFGSLALTGVGHATDRAVLLGLSGERPETIDIGAIEPLLAKIRNELTLQLLSFKVVGFVPERDLLFHRDRMLPGHPNGLQFSAFGDDGEPLLSEVYYSIGGGFVVKEGEKAAAAARPPVPFPFSSAAELLDQAGRAHLSIAELVFANEVSLTSPTHVREQLDQLWAVMDECINRGLTTPGILPGGLNVRRRAPRLWEKLNSSSGADPLRAIDQVNVFAMAVNEENAAGGKVVTAPTNGAAGLLPAVARYYRDFLPGATREGLHNLLLTAGAIGILYKENASISGAEVGCQGEVGVACSMAAGGLAGALGASNEQIEHAAEIGMEHHLGLTCDPIGGLVQIPCIERNAVGAVKAINACRMAMSDSDDHKVTLDQVIQTMFQTGLDMQSRYKETALAGLAVNVTPMKSGILPLPVNLKDC